MDEEFERLLQANRTAAERWVRAHISSPADADDVLQETFLAAFRSFPDLRDQTAFLPWLLSIARRKRADWFRARARRMETPTDSLPETAGDEDGGTAVEETLDALPERDRLMLRLFYREMLSQKQISQRLCIPEGTVKSRMNAARSRFRAAYPYPPKEKRPKGEKRMTKPANSLGLPLTLPEYTIERKDGPAFPVECEELMGWFIVPRLGERLVWGMYDLPGRKLDVSYEMAVTGRASVHGLEGVAIRAIAHSPEEAPDGPVRDAVDASDGGSEEWTFIAQEKDGYTRFLSAERLEDGVRTLTTFLDGESFMDNWGFGENNCGTPVHMKPRGNVTRNGNTVSAPDKGGVMDLVGRYRVTLDGAVYDTVCLMDLGMYQEGVVSEQYLDRSGRTVLWRRFNRDDWALDRYGKRWSELLSENERIAVNGQTFVHWYDCLIVRE